jgi:hypothetical protein
MAERKSAGTSWFCQYLGVLIPLLRQLASGQHGSRPGQPGNGQPTPLVCPCNRRVIDEFGDHIHARKKHTSSMKDAHETVLTALEQICHDSGLSSMRHNIPAVQKPNGKTGRGDLVIKDANLGDHRHLVVDTVITHEISGNHLADVSQQIGHYLPLPAMCHPAGPGPDSACRSTGVGLSATSSVTLVLLFNSFQLCPPLDSKPTHVDSCPT